MSAKGREKAMLSAKEIEEFTEEFEADDDGVATDETKQVTGLATKSDKSDTDTETINQDAEKEDSNNAGSSLAGSDNKHKRNDGSNLWDGLSDGQREEVLALQSNLAKAQHADTSNRGRQKALHAKVIKLESQIEEIESAKVSSGTIDHTEDDDSDYSREELETLRGDLPEVNALIENSVKDLKAQVTGLSGQLEAAKKQTNSDTVQDKVIENDFDQQAYNLEVQKVLAIHPDFEAVRSDPNYSTWLNREPGGIQALANSPNADDAIALIGLFKQARKPKDLSKELDAMTDIPSKGAGKSTAIQEDDFDAHFEYFGKQKLR